MRDNRRRIWVALAILWTLAIMALCWLPISVFWLGGSGERVARISNIDKLIHAGIFAIFGLLWLLAVSGKRRFLVVPLAGIALAATTEIVQSLPILDRDGDILDAAFDIGGVLAACALVAMVALARGGASGAVLTKPAADA